MNLEWFFLSFSHNDAPIDASVLLNYRCRLTTSDYVELLFSMNSIFYASRHHTIKREGEKNQRRKFITSFFKLDIFIKQHNIEWEEEYCHTNSIRSCCYFVLLTPIQYNRLAKMFTLWIFSLHKYCLSNIIRCQKYSIVNFLHFLPMCCGNLG